MTGKELERDIMKHALVLVRERTHPLVMFHRNGDGIEQRMTRQGLRFVPLYKSPADFDGMLQGGRAVLIEVKHVQDGASLHVVLPPSKGAGLQPHQLDSLITCSAHGGLAGLIVGFAKHGVWWLSGLALAEWRDGGDESNNSSSISLLHFNSWGTCLGTIDHYCLRGIFDEHTK